MVLDRASDYKMVSIMRQKRPAISTSSDDVPEAKTPSLPSLPIIEEENSMRWTAALPKFGESDYLKNLDSNNTVNQTTDASSEADSTTGGGDKKSDEVVSIHGHTDSSWHR